MSVTIFVFCLLAPFSPVFPVFLLISINMWIFFMANMEFRSLLRMNHEDNMLGIRLLKSKQRATNRTLRENFFVPDLASGFAISLGSGLD